MDITLIRQGVWLDYKIAVVILVILPLVLLFWTTSYKKHPVKRSLYLYWQTCSLLGVGLILLVGSVPVGYLVAWLARVLIVISLWFWQDINQDLVSQAGALRFCYRSWRWAVSTYCLLANIWGAQFLPCAFTKADLAGPTCQALREIPLIFKETFLPSIPVQNLAALGLATFAVFGFYFGAFLFFRLPYHGRKALRE